MTLRVIRLASAATGLDGDWTIENEVLAPVGAELLPVPCHDEDELVRLADQADGVLTVGVPIGARALAALTRCRGIVTLSHGFDHIDVDAATECGIPVANTLFCIREVANHTLMLLLASARRLLDHHLALAQGEWRRDLVRSVQPLYGQTLGLLGCGHIGQAVAQRALAFDLRVIAHDPNVPAETLRALGVEPVDFDTVFREADFVSLHLPLSKETRHLVGEREFRLMKPTAHFINTARGPIVDQAALVRALREGWIAAAALDVFEQEPVDPNDPILKLPNVILTPHYAGGSALSLRNARRLAAENLAQILSGRRPATLVNPAVRATLRFPLAD